MSAIITSGTKFLDGTGVVTLGSIASLETSAMSPTYCTLLAVSISKIVVGPVCARLACHEAAVKAAIARRSITLRKRVCAFWARGENKLVSIHPPFRRHATQFCVLEGGL